MATMDYATVRNEIDREFFRNRDYLSDTDSTDSETESTDSETDSTDSETDSTDSETDSTDETLSSSSDDSELVAHDGEEEHEPVTATSSSFAAALQTITPAAALPPSLDHAGDLKRTILNIDSTFREDRAQTSSDFTWLFDPPMKNVIEIALHSTEIPNTFYTFSTERQNISFKLNSTLYTIPEGNYSVIDLLEAVEDVSSGISCALEDNHVKVTLPSGTHTLTWGTEDRPVDFGLGYNLGFAHAVYTDVSGTLTAESVPKVLEDSYILLQVADYDGVVHPSYQDTVRAFAKLKVRGAKNETMHEDGQSLQSKKTVFTHPTDLKKWQIRLLDKYGRVLDLNEQEMSLSMEITQINSSHLFELYRRMGTYE
jgi:hypothetical protein